MTDESHAIKDYIENLNHKIEQFDNHNELNNHSRDCGHLPGHDCNLS